MDGRFQVIADAIGTARGGSKNIPTKTAFARKSLNFVASTKSGNHFSVAIVFESTTGRFRPAVSVEPMYVLPIFEKAGVNRAMRISDYQ
jgi:hypothetical protein